MAATSKKAADAPPTEQVTDPAPPDEQPEAVADASEREQLDEQADAGESVELPVMSAGVASDLAMQGWAGDPATGGMWRRDAETGETTYTPRS